MSGYESEEVKASLNASLVTMRKAESALSQAYEHFGDMQGALLAIATGGAEGRLIESISLISAIRSALEMDMANINVLGTVVVTYRNNL